MIQIPLTRGFVALIDEQDASLVLPYKWYAHKSDRTTYAERRIGHNGPIVKLHNALLSPPRGFTIDHINGNGLDNRRSNLRLATPTEQNRNRGKFRACSSRYVGVCWNPRKKRWQARLTVNRREVHLGWFKEEAEAAHHYDFAAVQCVGPFARLNFSLSIPHKGASE